jgi:hypothetical protein
MKMQKVYSSLVLIGALAAIPLNAQRITVQQVIAQKKRSESRMQYNYLQFMGRKERHAGFGLALGTVEAAPRYTIEGINQNGQNLSFPLSDIISLRAVSLKSGRIDLEVTRFNISPQALIDLNPNCSTLMQRRETTTISVLVTDNQGNVIYWLGRPDEYSEIAKLGPLGSMQTGVSMRLQPPVNLVWWAIPSITNDPLCPIESVSPLGGNTELVKPQK